MTPFLSNLTSGSALEVEAPNGVRTNIIEGEDSWAEHAPRKTLQFGGPTKQWGARSGTGKTLKVD
jgi:hypothetical protein